MLTIKLRYALGLFCCSVLSGTSAAADTNPQVLNAEDLAPLDGGKWVLASSMIGGLQKQGGIYAIEVSTGKAQQIYPNDEAGKSLTPDCPAPVAAKEFEPHGIAVHGSALGKKSKHENLLYVVNHGERESVEIFAIEQSVKKHGAPILHWLGCIPTPAGTAGNAVAATDDGTVYMTNSGKPLDGSPPASPYGGNVIAWTSANGWRDVPGSIVAVPNGLVISPDGKYLYLASWRDSKILKLALDGTGEKRELVKVSFHPDNLRWAGEGHILATGHRATGPEVGKCLKTVGRCETVVPAAIAEIDVNKFAVTCTQATGQSMATVAVNVGNEQWIGAVRAETILRVPRNAVKCE